MDAYSVAIQAVLKACQDGKPQHELWLPVCSTPQYLVDMGFPSLPIGINGGTVDKVHFDHGITKGVLERLPTILAAPQALFRSTSAGAVVVTFELKAAENIIIAMHPDKQVGRGPQRLNVVASIYAKRPEVILKWRENGLLVWEAKAAK